MLSAFKALNHQTILIAWILFFISLAFYTFSKKKKILDTFKSTLSEKRKVFRSLEKREKIISYIVFFVLGMVFVQGIIYPPNNWDSMHYHMPRISYWMGQESVEHSPTGDLRQLYMAPFAEFVIMHLIFLSYGDIFSNSVQLIFFVFSLISFLAISNFFEFSIKEKILSSLFFITITELLLQASTTKNDIVVVFFVLTSLYFAIKFLSDLKLRNGVFLGLSVGLSLLTKGTAYIYVAPILLLFSGVLL